MIAAPSRESILDRVEVDEATGCWLWTLSRTSAGYGQAHDPRQRRRRSLAHRLSYELFVGPIPEGLQLDHLCRVRHCVNPSHLEPVTQAENMRRGMWASRTHCSRGHEYTQENTYLTRGFRECRTCHAERQREQRAAARGGAPKHGEETHCKRGHEFTVENTYLSPRSDGYTSRACRACRSEAEARRRARRKLAAVQVETGVARGLDAPSNGACGHP